MILSSPYWCFHNFPFLIMPSASLRKRQYKFDKSLVWLDQEPNYLFGYCTRSLLVLWCEPWGISLLPQSSLRIASMYRPRGTDHASRFLIKLLANQSDVLKMTFRPSNQNALCWLLFGVLCPGNIPGLSQYYLYTQWLDTNFTLHSI